MKLAVSLRRSFGLGLAGMEGNFPHSSPHSAVLRSCSWKGVDNTPVFWLLPSSAPTARRLSLQPPPPPQSSKLGVGKRLAGDTARTADPNGPREIFHRAMEAPQLPFRPIVFSYHVPPQQKRDYQRGLITQPLMKCSNRSWMLPTHCTVPKAPLYGMPVASHTVFSKGVAAAAAYTGFTYICVPLPKSQESASYRMQETAKPSQRHASNDWPNHYLSIEHC